jgi:hypothetical protein
MMYHAVLLDTVSIQRYVFASSKLKENIGASHLVKETLNAFLKKQLEESFPNHRVDLENWQKQPAKHLIKENPHGPFEIGYIGGGNALLFFQTSDKARDFIKTWTTGLMVEAPGIAAAVAGIPYDPDNFEQAKHLLFKKLKENKNKFIPQTVIPRHGITAECSRSGYSLESWNKAPADEESGYVSAAVKSKIDAVIKANEKINADFADILGDKYCFTDRLDELGHRKNEDSHIAIVHIDGNDMGRRFQKTKTLEETRRLSNSVREITMDSFRELLKHITFKFANIENALGFDTKEKKKFFPKIEKRKVIPLRPIIIGGDDITFVCTGKLGIYLANCFLQKFEELAGKNEEINQLKHNLEFDPLSACAGIAVTKTKYPFSRGYELAEQLCRNAKRERRKDSGKSSWLDFHIAYGGFSGTLEEIRKFHYQVPRQGSLLFRPYRLEDNKENNFNRFVEKTKQIKKIFPKSKLMQLREELTRGETASRTFHLEMSARSREFPVIPNLPPKGSLWWKDKTPYFDMIELIEFYPSFALEDQEKNNE